MALNRKQILRRVKHRYKKVKLFKKKYCTYCGEHRNGKDRVPAVINSYYYGLEQYHHIIVPCCNTCNSMLSDLPLHTLETRAEYLYKRYEKRFASILEGEYWSEEEISEMGDLMRPWLRGLEEERRYAEDILYHLESLMIMCGKIKK